MMLEKISEKYAVAFSSHLLVEDRGLNFETNGTRSFYLYFEPGLSPDHLWIERETDLSQVTTKNPQILATMSKTSRWLIESKQRKFLGVLFFAPTVTENDIKWFADIDQSTVDNIGDACSGITEDDPKNTEELVESIAKIFDWSTLRRSHSVTYSVFGLPESDPGQSGIGLAESRKLLVSEGGGEQ